MLVTVKGTLNSERLLQPLNAEVPIVIWKKEVFLSLGVLCFQRFTSINDKRDR